MSLPQPSEYDDAIQNPQFAFLDAELRSAVNDGPLRAGLPGPVASGNFAIVYRFRRNDKRYAVKCFTREKADQHSRYQHIHEYLAARKLPWTVDFQFVQAGIRVKGAVHPILKMQWLHDAVTLQTYLTQSIKNGRQLEDVRDQFYAMATDLRRNTIAHGDLQHGNLIISDGKLRLIDYDGMCVPRTQGLHSDEDGLPDYQHPARNGGTLQPHFDNFASLVIWTSLHALTIDPTLWDRYVGESERLLFRKQDFLKPSSSGLIRELTSYEEPTLKKAVTALANAASESALSRVPHLTDIIEADTSSTAPSIPWWQADLKEVPKAGPAPPELPPWITESQKPQSLPERFRRNYILSAITALGITAIAVLTLMGVASALSPLIAAASTGTTLLLIMFLLYVGFRASRQRRKFTEVESELRGAEGALSVCQLKLQEWQAPHLARIAQLKSQFATDEAKLGRVTSEIAKRRQEIADQLRSALAAIASERTTADRDKVTAIRLARQDHDTAKSNLDSRIRAAEAEQKSAEEKYRNEHQQLLARLTQERQNKFKEKFDAFVQAELQRIDIGSTTVSGISYPMIQSLRSNGIPTAADLVSYSMDGSLKTRTGRWVKIKNIGHTRARELVNWRLRMMRKAEDKIPEAEKRAITRLIDDEEQREKQRLASVLSTTKQRIESQKIAAKQDFDKSIVMATSAEAQALQQAKSKLSQLDSRESSAKTMAKNREESELTTLNRELWALQSVVNPARHRLSVETRRVESESNEFTDAVRNAKKRLTAATMERARFGGITFGAFCKLILLDR